MQRTSSVLRASAALLVRGHHQRNLSAPNPSSSPTTMVPASTGAAATVRCAVRHCSSTHSSEEIDAAALFGDVEPSSPPSSTARPSAAKSAASSSSGSSSSTASSVSSSSSHPIPITTPYVTPTSYRPHYTAEDVADLLRGVGLWEVVAPILMARAGAASEEELVAALRKSSSSSSSSKDSSSATSALFTSFDQFSPLFTAYFTFEDRQLSTAGEVLLQHYMAEAIADYSSYYNLVLSPASYKQLSAAAINYYSLRLWAEDGCGLQRFLSAPPMLSLGGEGEGAQKKKTEEGADDTDIVPQGRLARHAKLRELLASLKEGKVMGMQQQHTTTNEKKKAPLLLPSLDRLLYAPPISQPSRAKDLPGTSFFHAAAPFAKGDLTVKLCHLIGVVEAEFGTDCAMWFVNQRFKLRDVGAESKREGEEGSSGGEAEDEEDPLFRGVSYEVFEYPSSSALMMSNPSNNRAVLSSTLNPLSPVAAAQNEQQQQQAPVMGVRMSVDWTGTVPSFIALVAKHVSSCLERYPSTAVCEGILQAQGLGCEYVGRSVLVPLPNPHTHGGVDANSSAASSAAATHATTTEEAANGGGGGAAMNEEGEVHDVAADPDAIAEMMMMEGEAKEAASASPSAATAEETAHTTSTTTTVVVDESEMDLMMNMGGCDEDVAPSSSPDSSSDSATPASEVAPPPPSFDDEDALDLIFCEAGEDAAAEVATSASAAAAQPAAMASPLAVTNQNAQRHPSALFSIAASPKPGVVDQIGKWVSRAAGQMERQRLLKEREGALLSGGGGGSGGEGARDASLLQQQQQREAASEAAKYEVTDGWLATPEKAPAWTNKIDFDRSGSGNNGNGGQSQSQQHGGGDASDGGSSGLSSSASDGNALGGYLSPVQPRVVRLNSDVYNVTGSFVSHPHRRLSAQSGLSAADAASVGGGDAAGGGFDSNTGFSSALASSSASARAPFVFPDYYNSVSGRFDKMGAVTDRAGHKGPNSQQQKGIELTKARTYRVGEREALRREEELLAAAAAKAGLGGGGDGSAPTDDHSVSSALAVLFGAGAATSKDKFAPKSSALTGANSGSNDLAAPYSALNVPKGMSVPEFIKTFTNPDEVVAHQKHKTIAAANGLAKAAEGSLVAAIGGEQSSSTSSPPQSLSAFLVQRQQQNNGSSVASSPNQQQGLKAAKQPYKTHQRYFEVSLVTFPADLPSIASTGMGWTSRVWTRPTTTTGESGPTAGNTVKVAVAHSIGPQYTTSRVEVSRKYLMGLVGDLEKLSGNTA